MGLDLDRLAAAVQANCNIADARHARELTLCTYLLEMREFFRWEQGKPYSEQLARPEVGAWIARREALWETLEDAEFMALPVMEERFEPFDAAAINAALTMHGIVYGAGIGRFGKPQFFLGRLEREEYRDGARVLVTGHEYARDLSPFPAALRGETIHLRRESLRRWLWEKIETWAVRKPGGALREALDAWRFDAGAPSAIERLVDAESETLILHELGEFAATQMLGAAWEAMCGGVAARRAELLARAVRDNLADCLVTLPALIERNASASIHFWFSNFDGMRREIFPQLADAYAAWRAGDRGRALIGATRSGREHWREVCQRLLAVPRDGGDAAAAIERVLGLPGTRL